MILETLGPYGSFVFVKKFGRYVLCHEISQMTYVKAQ